MKRNSFILAVLAALIGAWAYAEVGFKALSVTATSQTYLLPKASASVMLCSFGANHAYFRLFDEQDIFTNVTTTATTSYTKLTAGTATAPICMSFDKSVTAPFYYKAVSIVCDTAESATVHVIYQ